MLLPKLHKSVTEVEVLGCTDVLCQLSCVIDCYCGTIQK